jgi:hypothetical protein
VAKAEAEQEEGGEGVQARAEEAAAADAAAAAASPLAVLHQLRVEVLDQRPAGKGKSGAHRPRFLGQVVLYFDHRGRAVQHPDAAEAADGATEGGAEAAVEVSGAVEHHALRERGDDGTREGGRRLRMQKRMGSKHAAGGKAQAGTAAVTAEGTLSLRITPGGRGSGEELLATGPEADLE